MNTKTTQQTAAKFRNLGICLLILTCVLSVLFWRCWMPGHVAFSNDGPYGGMEAAHNRLDPFPGVLTGYWGDLNGLGSPGTAAAPDITTALRLLTSPLICSKIYPAFALFVLGLCAWICFKRHGFSPLACLVAALAAALNSDFLGTACWGVCSQPIGFGMGFLALGALADQTSPRRWLRTILAGFAVGVGIMQAYDIGALFSLFVGAYVVAQSLLNDGPVAKRLLSGVSRLSIVGISAGLISAAALMTLVGTQIKGVAGTEQDAESKAARWSFSTQYSIPKVEALGIAAPGLFGFRHDTPDGGEYWGRAGSDPSWDEFVASEGQKGQPSGAFRAGAGSHYAGVLVILLAIFGLAQSFRKQGSSFNQVERKLVWFWGAVAVIALLMMFGRFAPFYQFFYALPYVSTIRNPAKFVHIVEWSLIILSAYGAEALVRTGFSGAPVSANGLMAQWKSWWAKAARFDRQWVIGSAVGVVAVFLAWFAYASSRDAVERRIAAWTNLQYTAAGRQADQADLSKTAAANATHSIGQVGRTALFLVPAAALVAVALSGYFRPRAKIGTALVLGFMVLDLVPVNRPWVVFVNWKVKYESNPIVDFLRQRPYEHRVALFPLEQFVDFRRLPREMMPLAQQYSFFAQIYGIEWTQQLFQFYNIQSLDIVQEPRVPQDKAAYEAALAFASPLRRWELTNTRYLLGPAAFVDALNQQVDLGKGRFRIIQRFDLTQKVAVDTAVPQSEQITVATNANGQLAVIDFAGALPRAKLYTNWRVSTNDPVTLQEWSKSVQQQMQQRMRKEMATALAAQNPTDLATLRELADKDFDPAQTVLLAETLSSAPSTNQNPGEVKFESYAPKHIVFTAKANAPAVLLLNDKYDSNWKAWVDGRPTKLLRCNFIARGVFLDTPGEHRVVFRYQPPLTGLYISVATVLFALLLLGYVGLARPASPQS